MTRYEKFVLVADNHGDQIDERVAAKLFSFMDDFKPHIAVHLGDNWNFDALRTKASKDDQAQDLEVDRIAGFEFANEFFKRAKKRVFLRGNHDERIYELAGSVTNAVARQYAQAGTDEIDTFMRKHRVEMLPYDSDAGIFQLGKLRCLHGYYHSMNSAREHAIAYGECVFGHVHNFSSVPLPAVGRRTKARSIGCLAKRKMKYNTRLTSRLRHSNGFAHGIVYPNGEYVFFDDEIFDDQPLAAPVQFGIY